MKHNPMRLFHILLRLCFLAFLLIVNTLTAVVKGLKEILGLIQKEVLEDSAKVFRNSIKALGEQEVIEAEIVVRGDYGY